MQYKMLKQHRKLLLLTTNYLVNMAPQLQVKKTVLFEKAVLLTYRFTSTNRYDANMFTVASCSVWAPLKITHNAQVYHN